jgi:succinate dehydrogenase / fumarate reductase cytochrome b subunit
MSRLSRITKTSIGKKLFMALSGVAMIAWLIGHLLGNLKVFFGAEEVNAYSEMLHQHPFLLWTARLGILGFFVIHVWSGVTLWLRNRASRPVGYHHEKTLQASLASRFMLATGILLLTFLVYHLLHFTFHVVNSEHSFVVDSAGRHDVYTMVVQSFRNPLITGAYVLAMAMLGQHLWHGATSAMQTAGLNHSAYNGPVRRGVKAFIVLMTLAFIAIPVSIICGLLPSAG